MGPRLAYDKLSPDAYKGLYATYTRVGNSSLNKLLFELVNLRVSQVNGCAYCIERHAEALRTAGESDKRIDTLMGWKISPHFSDAERAALAWVDAVTKITDGHAPDDLFDELKLHFSNAEISDLTFAISIMNALNRLAISMRR